MSSDVIAVLVAIAIVAAIGFVGYVKRPRRVEMSKDAQEGRAAAAARRGWRMEVTGKGDDAACVYSGTTDFIPWRCEMRARDVVRGTDDSVHQTAFTKWSTDAARLGQGLLLVTPRSGDEVIFPAAMPPELLPRLAPLMEMLGIDPRDIQLVAKASAVDDAALNVRYRVRTTEASAAQRFLDAGGRVALVDAGSWLTGPPHPLIALTLGRRGLTVLLRGWIDDLDVVERVAKLGSQVAGVEGQ